jgi:hypothetical protein
MRAVVAQGRLISPVLFSLYVNDMPSPSKNVELAIYADDTAVIATSRKPTLFVSYLESCLTDLQLWSSEWRVAMIAIIFARAGRRFIQPRPVTLFGEPIKWVETTRSLGVTLPKRLTWSPDIVQVRKKTGLKMGVLLYKRLIRPILDYACPAWSYAARTHVRRLQLLKSKCLRLATGALRYVSNRQIHEDVSVPLFAVHITALIVSFDSKLADVGNPLVRQIGRYLR